MGLCYFCSERQTTGYFHYYCEDCSTLRRLLLVNEPTKCIDILKRVLTRDGEQIDRKIKSEIKTIEKKVEKKVEQEQEPDDQRDYHRPKTRFQPPKKI